MFAGNLKFSAFFEEKRRRLTCKSFFQSQLKYREGGKILSLLDRGHLRSRCANVNTIMVSLCWDQTDQKRSTAFVTGRH